MFLDDDYDDYDTGTQEQGKTAAPKKKNDVNSVEGVEGSLISISAIILLAFILVLVLPYDIHCLQYDTRWPRDLFLTNLAQVGPMNIMFDCECQNVLTVAWLELLFSIDTR